MPTAFETLKQKSVQIKPVQNGGISAFEALKAKPVSDVSRVTPPEETGGIKGFAKSLLSAPLTILARPLQLGAELLGASAEDVDKFSKEKLGGFVAPVPRSPSDVIKDVG